MIIDKGLGEGKELGMENCRMDGVADQFISTLKALEFHEKVKPAISPPNCRTRDTVAAAVPPVASKSSTISTRSPTVIASRWMARRFNRTRGCI